MAAMKKILVTGAAGYIGSVLCPLLVQSGYEVTALDLPGRENPDAQNKIRWISGDIRDSELMRALMAETDAIIWLAALVGTPACAQQNHEAWEINFESVKQIKAFKKPEQILLFPMTNSGYHLQPFEKFATEKTAMSSDTVYGQSKLAAEKELLALDGVISLRLASLYGESPAMRWDLLLHHMVREASLTSRLEIYEPDAKRNFVHVRDVAECFIFCLQNNARIKGCYNLALDSANITKKELAFRIQKLIPDLEIKFHDRAKDPDGRDFFISSEQLRRAGFVAQHSLEEGIAEIANKVTVGARRAVPLHKNVTAVLLAGGLGTRLRSVWEESKVLAPVAGQPFIAHLLRQIADAGFDEVILCTGYKDEGVREILGENFAGVRLKYSKEEQPMGTGGALRLAMPHLKSDWILVMNGDSFCPFDLKSFTDYALNENADITMALAATDRPKACGRVILNGGKITEFGEKKEDDLFSDWVSAGIYMIKREVLEEIPEGKYFSLEKDLFPRRAIGGFISGQKVYDIGTPDSYLETQRFFEKEITL